MNSVVPIVTVFLFKLYYLITFYSPCTRAAYCLKSIKIIHTLCELFINFKSYKIMLNRCKKVYDGCFCIRLYILQLAFLCHLLVQVSYHCLYSKLSYAYLPCIARVSYSHKPFALCILFYRHTSRPHRHRQFFVPLQRLFSKLLSIRIHLNPQCNKCCHDFPSKFIFHHACKLLTLSYW